MRIDPFSLRLSTPLDTGTGTIETRDGYLVHLERADTEGIGEATPLRGWTESLPACRTVLEGIDDPEASLADIQCAPAARHGLELALLDARGRSNDRPLYRELGATDPVERVPVNATIGDLDIERTVERAVDAVDTGYKTLKVKVGARSLAEDIERVRGLRSAIGASVAIRLDANGSWSLDQARRAFDELAALGVEYVEQPLDPTDLAGHATLSGGDVGVALDESLTVYDVERILDRGSPDVLVCKPMVLGGPRRATETARRARAAGVDPVVTTTIDGAVARTAAVHVAAALAPVRACGLATATMLADDVATDPTTLADGTVTVPQRNGLGVHLRGDG